MPVPFVLVLFASGVVLAYAQHNVLVAPHDAHMGFHERPFVHDDVIMDDHHHGYPMDGYHRDYPDMHDDYHHVEHIDAAPVERIEETHVHAPDITHHQEIIHHEPVDVIHEPVLVEHDDEVLHDNVHGHDLFDEFPMHHHHPHHLGVMGAFFGHDDDDDRHVDSEHGDDEVVDNDHSEFADDLNQFTNREKGRNKRKQGGTDKSNVQVRRVPSLMSLALTAACCRRRRR